MATKQKQLEAITVPDQSREMIIELSRSVREIDNQIGLTASTVKAVLNVNGDYALSQDASALVAEGETDLPITAAVRDRIIEMAQRQEILRGRMEVIVATLLDAYGVAGTHELSPDGSQLVPVAAPEGVKQNGPE